MPVNVENFRIADFQQVLDHVADDQNVVLKENGFEAKGKAGAFFAGKTARRNAAEALYHAVKAQYGQTVADTLAPQLRDSMVNGKPLSARTVQTVLADAQEFRQAIYDANAEAVHAFVNRNTAPGDTRNLDAALAPLFAELGLNGAEQAVLEGQALQSIATTAAHSGKLLSFEDFKNIGLSTVISAVQNAYTDRLSAQHGLNAEEAAQMRQLVQLSAAQARVAAPGQAPLSPGQICLAAERGELPGQQALLFAMGKCDHPEAAVRDAMLLTTDANRVDMALFCETSNFGGGIALNVRVLEHLPEMRQMQPEGPLNRETLWKGCFGEKLPATQAGKDDFHFYRDMLIKLEDSFSALKPGDPMAGFKGMMFHAYGLSTEKCSQAVMGPTSLTLGDFIASPSLYAVSRLPVMDANAVANAPRPAMAAPELDPNFAALFEQLEGLVPQRREDSIEHQLAKDLYRRGTHNGIQGFSPVISFGVPGQPVQSVNIQDIAGLTEAEQADFRDGKPSPMTASLVQHCRELCNGNEVQARALAIGLTQAGTMFTRTLSPACDILLDEHSPHHMDARRNEDGSVSLRIYTPENSPMDADYTFTIQPDGQSKLTAFHMQPATGDLAVNIQRDPRFSAMPLRSQKALSSAMRTVATHTPEGPERQAALERLKNDFFGVKPAGYDLQRGLEEFKEELLRADAGFLTQTQQRFIGADGIHSSFTKDTARHSINSFTSADGRREEVPYADEAAGRTPKDLSDICTGHLLRILGEEHRDILPFVSMMASQAGMDSAISFLPHMTGLTQAGDMHLMNADINPPIGSGDHHMDVIRNGNLLTIHTDFWQGYFEAGNMRGGNDQPDLILKGNLDMVIDLSVPPTAHEVNGKVVFVPQFTLENGDIQFTAPLV